MKKGIIFDVDGTLWDASAQVVDSWNEVLSMHPGLDVSITVEDMNNNMGKTMDELGRAFFPSFSHEERTRFMKECMEYENRYLETHPGVLYPGVKETVIRLAGNYELFIVSNCQSGYIEVLLKTSGLGEYIKDMEALAIQACPRATIYGWWYRGTIWTGVFMWGIRPWTRKRRPWQGFPLSMPHMAMAVRMRRRAALIQWNSCRKQQNRC